jgi:YD repeat-containing protein
MRHITRFFGFSSLLAALGIFACSGWSAVRADSSRRLEVAGPWAELAGQQPKTMTVPPGTSSVRFVVRETQPAPHEREVPIGSTTSSSSRTLPLRLSQATGYRSWGWGFVQWAYIKASVDGVLTGESIGYEEDRVSTGWTATTPYDPYIDGYWLVSVIGDTGLGDGLPPVVSINGEREATTYEVDGSLTEVRVPISVLDPGGVRSVSVNGAAVGGFSVGEKHVTTSVKLLLPRQGEPFPVRVIAIDSEAMPHQRELTVHVVRRKGSSSRGQCDPCDGIGACTAKGSDELSGTGMKVGDRCLYHRREYRADEPHVDGMGLGWTHWHTAQLCQTTDGVDDYVNVRLPCNRRAEYRRQADGTWEPVEPVEFDLFFEQGAALPWTVVSREGQRMLFDEHGFMVASVDANGVGDHLSLAPDGRLLQAHDDSGNAFTFVNEGFRLAAVVDQTGRRLEYQYETGALGNPLLVQMTKPGGGRRTYGYDERERLVAVFNEVGTAIEEFDYDEYDQLVATRRGPHEVSRNIDWDSRTMTEVDSVRGTTFTTFNEFNLVTYRREPTGAEYRYTYDPVTRKKTSMTDANGRTESYGHDDRGNLTSYTDGSGNVWSSVYETINGRECRVRHEDAQGHVTLSIHDDLGNLVSTIDPLGNSDLAVYRADGQVASYRDENGAVTTFSYDELGRRIAETDALRNTSSCSYDAVGNKISETDKCGGVTRSEFDGARQLVKTTFLPADG